MVNPKQCVPGEPVIWVTILPSARAVEFVFARISEGPQPFSNTVWIRIERVAGTEHRAVSGKQVYRGRAVVAAMAAATLAKDDREEILHEWYAKAKPRRQVRLSAL